MSLLVVGSLALDTLETPFGKREYILGGSATYISIAASYFSKDIRLVGTVGYDFPEKELKYFESKGIDISGINVNKTEKTFHWHGVYHTDMNTRDSITTDLNAFAFFDPVISDKFSRSDFVCLGNVDPVIQGKVIKQLNEPEFVMIDTMNFWIEGKPGILKDVLKKVNLIVLNDEEARLLSGENNILSAAKKIMELGPKNLIIKKGEHGAMLFKDENLFYVPAVPLSTVIDPTGAGDTFAGGFIGWLSRTQDLSFENMKNAVVFGTVIASLTCEDFSVEGLRDLNPEVIEQRLRHLKAITNFEIPRL
jgi:sugar/nucleoside kinase (ribokinase family)